MKKSLLTALLFSNCSFVFCQAYFYNNRYYDNIATWEAGISTGIMNCLTDLGGRPGTGKGFIKDLNWNQTQLCAGIYTGFLYQYVLGARLEVTFGKVSAADNILKNDHSAAGNRFQRNLHFRSSIVELSLIGEIHPLALIAYRFDKDFPLFSPYLLAGVGVFKFKPEAQLAGNWISLPELRTEGQGFREYPDRLPYKLTQVNFPVGIGLKYELSALLNARIELVHRILHTDYLDDVSQRYIDPALFYNYLPPSMAKLAEQLADRQHELNTAFNAPLTTKTGAIRGNPKKNDTFFSITIKFGVILNRHRK